MRSFIALAVGTALACSTGAAAHKHEDKNQNHTVPEIRDTWFAPATATSASIADGLAYTALNPPLKFVHHKEEGVKMNKTHVKIRIHDHKVYQQIRGFGGSLTDSSASTLAKLKKADEKEYEKLLDLLFSPKDDDHSSAALSFLRLPMGATDFSTQLYSYADKPDDKDLSSFKVNNTDLFSVLGDILKISPNITIQALPWSPPAWMKKNDAPQIKAQLKGNPNAAMMGGTFDEKHTDVYAQYFLKTLQAYQKQGVNVTFLGLQNEPLNQDFTYPSCMMKPETMAKLGGKVREVLDKNGFNHVQLSGYEHNWSKLTKYSNALKHDKDVFGAYGTHCYSGSVKEQHKLHKDQPHKEILLTQCTSTVDADFWGDLQWQAEHVSLGAVNRFASVGAMWNLALDGASGPKLNGTKSCEKGCRGIVTVDGKSATLSEQFLALGMVSKAVIPRDVGGPAARRVKVKLDNRGHARVHAGAKSDLTVSAFVTERTSPTEPERVSVVVLNKSGHKKGVRHRKQRDITATIKFRKMRAEYTFKPGMTTLTFYADKKHEKKHGRHHAREWQE